MAWHPVLGDETVPAKPGVENVLEIRADAFGPKAWTYTTATRP
jgi:hypothetical protein